VEAIVRGLKKPNLEQGTAGAILAFVRKVSSDENQGWKGRIQDEQRVRKCLFNACALHRNADYLFYELHPRSDMELVHDLDIAIKAWLHRSGGQSGGLFGGFTEFRRFASRPSELKALALKGMAGITQIWYGLTNEDHEVKEKFVHMVLEHDKGYNRIVESINNWVMGMRPQETEESPRHVDKRVGLGRKRGKKGFSPLMAQFGIAQPHARTMLRGELVGRIFYIKGEGSYKLTGFDQNTREYEFEFLGSPNKMSLEDKKYLHRKPAE
jgi:hypothetical protein